MTVFPYTSWIYTTMAERAQFQAQLKKLHYFDNMENTTHTHTAVVFAAQDKKNRVIHIFSKVALTPFSVTSLL